MVYMFFSTWKKTKNVIAISIFKLSISLKYLLSDIHLSSFCKNNTLDSTLIRGKIVVCNVESLVDDDRGIKAYSVGFNGGVGMILIDPMAKDIPLQFLIATALILPAEAEKLYAYLTKEKYVDLQLFVG